MKTTMHLKGRLATIATALVLATTPALAGGYTNQQIGWQVTQPARFMVTGVLRLDGTNDTIKPIHAIIAAASEAEALSKLIASAKRQYPGYTLISTLASPVPAAGKCEISI
ncbi:MULTISPECIES: hypothetical protein [unclassified Cupriavidus]|uniref:hypothetical protein n=1 Tax=unclassified Cupriavidus TaxID=2640874 RepID=UPI00313CBC72